MKVTELGKNMNIKTTEPDYDLDPYLHSEGRESDRELEIYAEGISGRKYSC